MRALPPLQTLFEGRTGRPLPLPPELARSYGGALRFPSSSRAPFVYANLASTLDGVAAFDLEHPGGGEVSGHDRHDRMVMGLLRAAADAIVLGAGTLRGVPHHLWTAERVFPDLAPAFGALRAARRATSPPLTVIVTSRGALDPELPVFQQADVPVLVVTTRAGSQRVRSTGLPAPVEIAVAGEGPELRASSILHAIARRRRARTVLLEGGPHLLGRFLEERQLRSLFLTLAPQIAGRRRDPHRLGLVEGVVFGPSRPFWAHLEGMKRSEDHLFLRYALPRGPTRAPTLPPG